MGSIPAILVLLFSRKEAFYFRKKSYKPFKKLKRGGGLRKTIKFTTKSFSKRFTSTQLYPDKFNTTNSKTLLNVYDNQPLVFSRNTKLQNKLNWRLGSLRYNLLKKKNKKYLPYKTRIFVENLSFTEKQNYYNSIMSDDSLKYGFRLRHRKISRLSFKLKTKKLKSNVALDYTPTDSVAFGWKSITSLYNSNKFIVVSLVRLDRQSYNNYNSPIIQLLSLGNCNNNQNRLITNLPSILELMREDYRFTISNIGLVRNVNSNNKVSFVSNFFNINRLSIVNIWQKQTDDIHIHNNLVCNDNTNNIPVLIFANQLWSEQYNLNRIVLLLSRYMPFINVSKFIRLRSYKKKIMIYFLTPKEYTKDTSHILSVTKRSKSFSLQMIGAKNHIKRLYPVSGFATLMGSVSNDNKLEVLADNHLYLSSYKHIKNLLSRTISSLFIILVNLTQPQNIIFGDSLKMLGMFSKKTPKALTTLLNPSWNYPVPTSNLLFNDTRFTSDLYNNPILFKYFLWNQSTINRKVERILSPTLLTPLLSDLGKFNYSTRYNFYNNSNLWPLTLFKYSIKRKIIKLFTYYKFVPNVSLWYHTTLVRFMESCSGRKVYLKFNPFIENSLTYQDLARCRMWECRIDGFQRMLGPKLFLRESLRIFHLAINYKDPTFLLNWMKAMLYRMNFFKYRLLFRYFKFVMRYLFWAYFPELNFKGLKLRLKGKISVAGNARTRKLVYAIGETSHATVNNRVISDFTTVNSFTGVMGFRMTFYF